MQRMEWGDVRVLLALLRAENMHEAARQLGVDRSTMSRRLSALETSLGTRLFVRTRDGLTPTRAAERLRAAAERMEEDARDLIRASADTGDAVKGIVRVATTNALATRLVSQGLLDVRHTHPDVTLEILSGNQPVDVARGEADIALRVSRVHGASLRVRCLSRTAIGLFASSDYLRARGAVSRPAALRGHDVLLPSGELRHLPESKWLASRPGIRVALRANNMPALVVAAVSGCGIAPLPVGWGNAITELEPLFVLDHIPKRPLWLVTRAIEHETPAAHVVAEKIASLLTHS